MWLIIINLDSNFVDINIILENFLLKFNKKMFKFLIFLYDYFYYNLIINYIQS